VPITDSEDSDDGAALDTRPWAPRAARPGAGAGAGAARAPAVGPDGPGLAGRALGRRALLARDALAGADWFDPPPPVLIGHATSQTPY